MNLKFIGAALLALTVVATGAVAAAPGNAPVDVPTDDYDAEADNADAAQVDSSGTAHVDASDAQAASDGANDQQGPPADLPGPVPDFVGEIHDLIRQHIEGSLDGILGDHVSDATPDEDAQSTGNASAA
ncbi:MAG: hypothetical protein ABEH64_13280 [Salinirussus sp.]